MDFELSEEDRMFQENVRKFCERELRPKMKYIDEKEEIPRELLKKMAETGLLGITIPEKYGGSNATVTQSTLAAIEIGRGDISMATAVYYLLEAGWGLIFSKYGDESLKEEVLPKVTNGDWFLGIASTEPCGGSDLLGTKTVAKKENGKYIIKGEKSFISGVYEAKKYGGGHLTLVKMDNDRADHRKMNFIYVPVNTEAIEVQRFHNMGRMGISTGALTYDNAKIPEQNRMGSENRGFYILMEGFNVARTLVSAACIGAGERLLEIGTEYLRTRMAFGVPIGKLEGLQFELADIYSQLEMAKLAVLKSAWMLDKYGAAPNKDRPDKYSELLKTIAIVKLNAPQIAFEIAKKVMIWHGAYGYTKEVDIELAFRGIMSYLVGAEGALNVMRVILGRELLGKEFIPYK